MEKSIEKYLSSNDAFAAALKKTFPFIDIQNEICGLASVANLFDKKFIPLENFAYEPKDFYSISKINALDKYWFQNPPNGRIWILTDEINHDDLVFSMDAKQLPDFLTNLSNSFEPEHSDYVFFLEESKYIIFLDHHDHHYFYKMNSVPTKEQLKNYKRDALKEYLKEIPANPNLVYHALELFPYNKELIKLVLETEGAALKYCSDEVKNSLELVTTAIKNHPEAIKFASKKLSNNKNLINLAVKLNPNCLAFASQTIKSSKTIVRTVVDAKPLNFSLADLSLRKDRGFCIELIKQYPEIFQVIDTSLKNDASFVQDAVNSNSKVSDFLNTRE